MPADAPGYRLDAMDRPLLPDSTLEGLSGAGAGAIGTWGRRVFLAALVAALVAGLLGFLGVHTATTSSATGTGETDGDWSVSLTHASVARAGLDVPWQVTVRRVGGFDEPVTLAVTGDYLDVYETQGFAPEPSAATRDGQVLYLEFDPPPGDTLVVDYDAYIQPSSQVGAGGTVGVYDGTRVLAPVAFDTRLLP